MQLYKQILFILLILNSSTSFSQKFELHYIILKSKLTFEQNNKSNVEFNLKSPDSPTIDIYHAITGTKITTKNQSYTIESYNRTTTIIKNIAGEFIGLKQKFDDYYLIGFGGDIFKVYSLKNDYFRIEVVESVLLNKSGVIKNIDIKTQKKTVHIVTNLEQIPAELIPAIYLDNFKKSPINLSYYQEKRSSSDTKLAISVASALIGIVLSLNNK